MQSASLLWLTSPHGRKDRDYKDAMVGASVHFLFACTGSLQEACKCIYDARWQTGWSPVDVQCRQPAIQPERKHEDEDHLTLRLSFKATVSRTWPSLGGSDITHQVAVPTRGLTNIVTLSSKTGKQHVLLWGMRLKSECIMRGERWRKQVGKKKNIHWTELTWNELLRESI